MSRTADFQRLKEQWYARVRATGFRDIESPTGIIPRRSAPAARAGEIAHLEAARAFLETHRFASHWEKRVWELHADGISNRQIARLLRNGRKRVEAALARLTAAMEGRAAQGRRRPGRPADPDGFRAEGMQVKALLLPAHAAALDHIRTVLQVSEAEAVRRGLMELRKRISRDTERRGQ